MLKMQPVRTEDSRPPWISFVWAVHGSENPHTSPVGKRPKKSPHPPTPLTTLCMCARVCTFVHLRVWIVSDNVRACICLWVCVASSCCMQHASFLCFFLVARGCAVNSSRLPTSPGQQPTYYPLKNSPPLIMNVLKIRNNKHRNETTNSSQTLWTFAVMRWSTGELKVLEETKSPRITNVRLCASTSRRAASNHDAHNLIYNNWYSAYYYTNHG